jgi:hypothetical protein
MRSDRRASVSAAVTIEETGGSRSAFLCDFETTDRGDQIGKPVADEVRRFDV